MAETFSEGTNKVWYRPANFCKQCVVAVKFRKPDGTVLEPFVLPDCESKDDGVYCFDYNFDALGQWLGIFYEDGIKVASSVFNIVPKTDPSVPYEGEYMKCETCVHFMRVSGEDYGRCDRVTKGNPYRRIDDTCPSYQDKSTG
jgi:hypothetical protein